MARAGTRHKWTFASRFRRHAFGWRSQPAIARVREAVAEISVAARHDKLLAAEGAVLLFPFFVVFACSVSASRSSLSRMRADVQGIGAGANEDSEQCVNTVFPPRPTP